MFSRHFSALAIVLAVAWPGVAAARQYFEAGFAVVYQDIIIGQDLARIAEAIAVWSPQVVVLNPIPKTLATATGREGSPATPKPSRQRFWPKLWNARRRGLGCGWIRRNWPRRKWWSGC